MDIRIICQPQCLRHGLAARLRSIETEMDEPSLRGTSHKLLYLQYSGVIDCICMGFFPCYFLFGCKQLYLHTKLEQLCSQYLRMDNGDPVEFCRQAFLRTFHAAPLFWKKSRLEHHCFGNPSEMTPHSTMCSCSVPVENILFRGAGPRATATFTRELLLRILLASGTPPSCTYSTPFDRDRTIHHNTITRHNPPRILFPSEPQASCHTTPFHFQLLVLFVHHQLSLYYHLVHLRCWLFLIVVHLATCLLYTSPSPRD